MAIVVQRVIKGGEGKWQCEVRFGDAPLVVDIVTPNARELVGKLEFVELEAERIERWEKTTLPDGITALDDGRHRIVGVIEDQMEIADGIFLYDLFIECGPNYYAIDGGELGGAAMTPGERVAIEVSGLSFHPTRA